MQFTQRRQNGHVCQDPHGFLPQRNCCVYVGGESVQSYQAHVCFMTRRITVTDKAVQRSGCDVIQRNILVLAKTE